MAVTFIDKKESYETLKSNVAALKGRSVKVGLWGDRQAEIAAYNEFGTSRGVPARPFMQRTFDENRGEMNQFIESLGVQIVEGKSDATRALKVLGEVYQAKIQETIRGAKGWATPNAPSTVAMKGSSSPLIDTGRMLNSVKYEIL